VQIIKAHAEKIAAQVSSMFQEANPHAPRHRASPHNMAGASPLPSCSRHVFTQGYRCLIPDIYRGKIGVDKEEASHLHSHLDWQRAVEDVIEGVKYLRAEGAPKVGSIGFCMGGALSLAAAQHAEINAAVPFYGTPQPGICQPENVKAPVQFHFGALDEFSGFSDAEVCHCHSNRLARPWSLSRC
jgi:dienelactone hydrolase